MKIYEWVQTIDLNTNTANKADITVNKRTYGRLRFGAGIDLNRNITGHVYIAEGPETALNIQSAMPNAHVIAALSVSNIAKIKLPAKGLEVDCETREERDGF